MTKSNDLGREVCRKATIFQQALMHSAASRLQAPTTLTRASPKHEGSLRRANVGSSAEVGS